MDTKQLNTKQQNYKTAKTKQQNYKTAKLQNSKLQNSKWYKTANDTKQLNTKQQTMQNSKYFIEIWVIIFSSLLRYTMINNYKYTNIILASLI